MVRMKAPPEWEVQVTREVGERLEIWTFGPFAISRAQQTAKRFRAIRNPAEIAVEVNRVEDQQEPLQW
jgi:glutathione peroxidase-family protein